MIDSTNVRVLADNIQKLQKDSSGLGSRVAALEVTAPKDYSEAETVTGQKWIDGKDVYKKVFKGTTVTAGSSDLPLDFDTLIDVNGYVVNTQNSWMSADSRLSIYGKKGVGLNYTVTTTLASRPYYIVATYTKPDPTPGRAPKDSDQEPEPEEKKTTKKKSSK